MTHFRFIIFIVFASVGAPSLALNWADKITHCANIENEQTRFACYEQLAVYVRNASGDKSTATTLRNASDGESSNLVTVVPEKVPKEKALSDEIGGGAFTRKSKSPKSKQANRGQMTSCKQAVDKKWFYRFENGQVWKQVDSKRRRHRQCEVMVSIRKDRFGYRMQINGESDQVRIKRIR